MAKRKIIKIDESKCDGCGLCVPSCAEGALKVIDGKARLVSEVYCDGLGACLGHCPQGAITIEEREAPAFDEAQVRAYLEREKAAAPAAGPSHAHAHGGGCPGAMAQQLTPPAAAAACPSHAHAHGGGCPGAMAQQLTPPAAAAAAPRAEAAASELINWPVQLTLVPPNAPYLRNADLLLAADCAPFALAGFHGRFLRGRPVAIACPKLDDAAAHTEKLAQIIRASNLRSITVARMEVPCCGGLVAIARGAIQRAGRPVPLHEIVIGIRGEVLADVADANVRA
ncbi:MAG TPA: 4Fe-4S binding protein [Planctomycetota bacterium]|nr:4Fe-4S binding protein [Planctomycetota bacterium]HNR97949.1 4Fe-4S binding protein [Planctomycetota bacterium]HNU24525.1 4Fe-4S binding protein [Planctomycetota bacterium]HOE86006.1 4Fe-4S binding protein [Planctomycetota bacterium]HOR66902.1 4Fe-4S binding protein [Planctomycetota bacterium]